jgi:hypothetical protein
VSEERLELERHIRRGQIEWPHLVFQRIQHHVLFRSQIRISRGAAAEAAPGGTGGGGGACCTCGTVPDAVLMPVSYAVRKDSNSAA